MSQEDSNKPEGQEFTPAVAFAMGEIKGTVENLRTDLKEWKNDLRDDIAARELATSNKIAALDLRVQSLEKWKWMIAGAAAAGGATAGKIFDIIAKATQ